MYGTNRDRFQPLDPLGLHSPFAEAGESREAEAFEVIGETPFTAAFDRDEAEWLEGFEPATKAEEAGAAETEETEEEFERCAADESFAEEEELSESESPAWTGNAEQLVFRSRVLAEHISRSTRSKGKPLRDLRDDELEKILGTNVKTKIETAQAAGRLLAAARADLAKAKAAGDADALRTVDASIGSGYRGSGAQRDAWLSYFGGYYNRTRAAREALPGGPHSDAAVAYMLRPEKMGGFGLAGRIAAPGYSNHQNGIAVDFIQNRTSQKVRISTNKENRRRWSKTWFYDWLQRNAATYEFTPYKKEEWHWEYKPKGSLSEEAELEHEAAGRAVSAPAKAFLGGSLFTYSSRACVTKVAVFVPPVALGVEKIDVMLYVHGLLSPCGAPGVMPEGIISAAPFKLGQLIVDSTRPMVLVVPRLQPGNDRSWSAHRLDRPGALNALFKEVFAEMSQRLGRPAAQLDQLVIAGHSRAFGVLYPLARSHASPPLATGALAKLSKVWVLDATYGTPPMAAFDALAASKPGLGVDIIYRAPSPTNKFGGRSRRGPVALRPINSRSISHCAVPSKVMPTLMAELAAARSAETGVRSDTENYASPYWESAPSDREESEQQAILDENPYLEADISYLDSEDEESQEDLPAETLAWLDTEAGANVTNESEPSPFSMELDDEGSEALPGFTLEETLRGTADEDEQEAEDESRSAELSYEGKGDAAESPLAGSADEDSAETSFVPETVDEADESEQPYLFEEESTTSADFRARAAEIANAEMRLWADGARKETDPAMRETLRNYWRTVRSGVQVERAIDRRSPWSAAFISTVMKRAGAGDSFRYSAAHFVYVAAAKQARIRGDTSKCWAYRIDEVRPEVGDLVCRDRASSKACSGATYDNVDDKRNRATHSDLVIEWHPDSIVTVGGNVADSVKRKVIALDARGFVAPPLKGCRYFAVVKPAGAPASTVTAEARSGMDSELGSVAALPARLADAVRNGMISVQVGFAIAGGLRDENKLTNLVFHGRHPELPSGYKIQSHEREFMGEWTTIRNDLIRPLLRALSGASSSKSVPATSVQSSAPRGINPKTVARIDGHGAEIERAATASGVPGNVIRGIVAAESGGNERTGEAGSGYKGLMQAERTADQLDAAASLRTGTAKYKDFSSSMRRYFRETLGTDFDALSEESRIRIVMAAYNAGPGTVKRAMRFAREAGNVDRWLDPEHYLRALVSYGAYNPVPGVLQWCVKQGQLSAADLASDLARLSGKSLADLQRTYQSGGTWSVQALGTALKPYLFSEKTRLKNDGSITFAQAGQRASKSLLCAARFKQAHTGRYLDTIVRYKRYYDGRTR